jgi:hypothetical protein
MPPPPPRKPRLYLDVGQRVFTPYGIGSFCGFNYKTGVYKVELDWKLANNQPVQAFLQAIELRKVEKAEYYRGQSVVTPFGVAKVAKFRPKDLMYELQLPWSLANGTHAIAYMLGTELKAQTVIGRIGSALAKPRYKDTPTQQGLSAGVAVDTAFGVGKVVQQRLKDSVYEIALGSAKAYMQADQVKKRTVFAKIGSVFGKRRTADATGGVGASTAKSSARKNSGPGFQVNAKGVTHPHGVYTYEEVGVFANGAAVVTSFGLGKVKRFRGADGVYEIELTMWKLATGKAAMAFMQECDLKKQTVAHKVAAKLTDLGSFFGKRSKKATPKPMLVAAPTPAGVIGGDLITPHGEEMVTPRGPGTPLETPPVSAPHSRSASMDGSIPSDLPTMLAFGETPPTSAPSTPPETTPASTPPPSPPLASRPLAKPVMGDFKDGSAVDTAYGAGKVVRFRPEDNMYEVELVAWKLANGKYALVYILGDGLKARSLISRIGGGFKGIKGMWGKRKK